MTDSYHDNPDQRILRHKISEYYRFQSQIYDFTRWSFLFGRKRLIKEVSRQLQDAKRITEFGCGTGTNLLILSQRFPDACLTGIDLSADMLAITKRRTLHFSKRLQLHQCMNFTCLDEPQDLILFSYCLSMVNPGWDSIIEQALASLSANGMIAVVDFNASPLGIYRRFMSCNHVVLTGEIYPFLQAHTSSIYARKFNAYWGVWSYFNFIGLGRY